MGRETTNMIDTVLVLVFSVASCLAQDAGLDYVDDFSCPDELEGYYPHLYSCDKYWACFDGLAELRTCGNGLAFIDTDESYKLEQCEELHLVECGQRTELQPAISTPNCPRLWGTFAGSSSSVSEEFPGSRAVPWGRSSVTAPGPELTGPALTRRMFLSVRTTTPVTRRSFRRERYQPPTRAESEPTDFTELVIMLYCYHLLFIYLLIYLFIMLMTHTL